MYDLFGNALGKNIVTEKDLPKKNKTKWSYSRRETMNQCLRKYYYTYFNKSDNVDLYKKFSNKHLIVGDIIHFTIEKAFKDFKYSQKELDIDDLKIYGTGLLKSAFLYTSEFSKNNKIFIPDTVQIFQEIILNEAKIQDLKNECEHIILTSLNNLYHSYEFADILETKLNNLLNEWNNDLIKYKPMNMLVIRDGKICEGELQAIESVISGLKTKRYIPDQFKVDAIEYHKSSLKNVMLYENSGGNIENCLEGSYYIFDKTNAFLATTGASTLTQGTANPILIKSPNENCSLIKVLQDLFTLSQFNFSSPTVAQKNCAPIKNADEQLKDRKSQEVERIK